MTFFRLFPLALFPVAVLADAPEYTIQLDTISRGFDRLTCWVHPRAAAIPGPTPIVVLTMKKLLLSASDVFGPITEMRTDDLGRTWSGPLQHADTLGRRLVEPSLTEGPALAVLMEGVADFWPKWHAASGKVLGFGTMVRYEGEQQVPHYPRQSVYSTYDPAARTWTDWTVLPMPADPKFHSAASACVQRLDLPNGDILLPIYHRPEGSGPFSVTVLRCRFDGIRVEVVEAGSTLSLPVARGVYEPSLTVFRGRYYLTLRNDLAGYVAASEDGLHFGPPKPWTWDDGTDLGNYNTQQHWVAHSDALYLVYTRRGANNDHIPRHRAPLFIAQVDPDRLQVRRATERILVPEHGARLGNFGITEVNEHETWVTVAEWMQTNGPYKVHYTVPMKYGADNRVYASRIQWARPNRTWNQR